GADAEHLVGLPVDVAADDLPAGDDQGAGGLDRGALVGDGDAVGGSEGLGGAGAGAVAFAAAGEDEDDVGAEALELLLYEVAAALADGHHRGDGGDADDHAEDSEPGAELVLGELAQGEVEQVEEVHGWRLSSSAAG